MFWLQRPPYARWAAAVLVVAVAAAIDLSDGTTVAHPFAATDLSTGAALSDEVVGWREVPAGLLPAVRIEGMFAARPVTEGEPLVPSVLTAASPVPAGWWSVEMELPEGTAPGTRARVVADDPPFATEAIVVSVLAAGAFDISTNGLVAVPAAYADQVAKATARGQAVLLIAAS